MAGPKREKTPAVFRVRAKRFNCGRPALSKAGQRAGSTQSRAYHESGLVAKEPYLSDSAVSGRAEQLNSLIHKTFPVARTFRILSQRNSFGNLPLFPADSISPACGTPFSNLPAPRGLALPELHAALPDRLDAMTATLYIPRG